LISRKEPTLGKIRGFYLMADPVASSASFKICIKPIPNPHWNYPFSNAGLENG